MLRLILMRHAKSDWNYGDPSDHDRPLNARGKASAAALGDWLGKVGYHPDAVLCSSAARTRETLQRLDLSPEPDMAFERALYLAEPETMMAHLKGAKETTVLMIGHNPGICALAHRLVDAPPAHVRFEDYPTGATLVCDFDASDWSKIDWYKGQVIDFVIPRELTD